MAAITVTAAQVLQGANSMALAVKVLTGVAGAQPGATAGTHGSGGTASQAITPAGTGSLVYGAILGGNTNLSANGSTTFIQNFSGSSLRFVQLESASTTTAGTPVTLGAASATTGLSIALCEILAAGTLAEDASAPALKSTTTAQTLTTASFTPPAGSLLVAMVSTNGSSGTTTATVSDSSSLTWTERSHQAGGATGYTGVWTARVAGAGSLLAGII